MKTVIKSEIIMNLVVLNKKIKTIDRCIADGMTLPVHNINISKQA